MVDPLLTYKWGNGHFWIVSSTLGRLNAYKSWDKRINGMFTNWRRISQPSTVVMLWSFPSIPDVQHRVKFWAVHGRVCHPPWRRLLHWARRSWALRWCPHWNLLKSSVEICWNLSKFEILNFPNEQSPDVPWCSNSALGLQKIQLVLCKRPRQKTGLEKNCINGVCMSMLSIVEYLEDLDNCGNFPLRTPTLRLW